MSRDKEILLDIASAARLIADFIEGMGKMAFLGDAKTQPAVLHQLLIMERPLSGFRRSFDGSTRRFLLP